MLTTPFTPLPAFRLTLPPNPPPRGAEKGCWRRMTRFSGSVRQHPVGDLVGDHLEMVGDGHEGEMLKADADDAAARLVDQSDHNDPVARDDPRPDVYFPARPDLDLVHCGFPVAAPADGIAGKREGSPC